MKSLNKFLSLVMTSLLFVSNGCKKDEIIINVTDADGNVYNEVKIGTQTWLSANLNTSKYNDGKEIPIVMDNEQRKSLSEGAFCNYNNEESYSFEFGKLYNWYSVSTGKLCPVGWHVSTDEEWSILISYLGGSGEAGGNLKEIGINHWASPNTGATNAYNFTALPAGHRYFNGSFTSIYRGAIWWTSTEKSIEYSWFRSIATDNTTVRRDYYYKNDGFSVRCIKDK